jgi:hypothetical protein
MIKRECDIIYRGGGSNMSWLSTAVGDLDDSFKPKNLVLP